MPKKRTDAEFREKLKIERPDIEPLEPYINNTTKIRVRKIDCGHEWYAIPHNLFCGSGCPECYLINRTDTHEVFVEKLEKINPNIEVLGHYMKSRVKIRVRCKVCLHEWDVTPNQLLQGYGCPECSRIAQTKTHEKFLMELKLLHPDLEPLDFYVNDHTKIRIHCIVCDNVWKAKPADLLQGCGCPICSRKRVAKKLTRFLKDVLIEIEKKYPGLFEYIGGYINTTVSCWWRCKICGFVWKARPRDILDGSGCAVCRKNSMEKPILEAFKKKNVFPLHDVGLEGSNYNGSSHPLRVDFIIETPKGKLAVEADGRHHFLRTFGQTDEDLINVQARDRYKDKILKEKGYILIRVTSSPTKEWGFKNHITLKEMLDLIEIGINYETGEIDFALFKKYDFNRK